ncbi:MAG: glycosyltransferase family 4 protein [Phycisphaerae bacterium]|nr:glycosyltransferase family 4 protein [Phycisphaerae bacterium]
MRILHLSTRLILGGSQENTVLSCEGQARLGHEVHLGFGPIYGPEGSLLARAEAFNARCAAGGERVRPVGGAATVRPEGQPVTPIAIHVLRHLVRPVRPWADHVCFHRELKPLMRLGFDVVHTHSSKAGILGRMAAWGRARAVVHTIHGPPFMPAEGGALRRLGTRLVNLGYERSERLAARRCHRILSVADAMTGLFLSRGIGRPGQYLTVHSGMEVQTYLEPAAGQSREEVRGGLGLEPSHFVIGTVARLAQHKGHDDLLDALGDRIRAEPTWRLLWVGDGWWRERLMARVRSMGLEGRVLTTGLVPQDRVPGLVRAMDLLVHPSYREGLPRTVPQALLCAVPVVAYDVDGTREACIEGVTGRLVRPGDVAALREAVVRMFADPGARRAMGERGRRMCRDLFSAERMVARLEEVYAQALA